jgi:uncharacterized membrane protein
VTNGAVSRRPRGLRRDEAYDPHPGQITAATPAVFFMSSAARTPLLLVLSICYLVIAHIALVHHSAPLAAAGVAALALLLLASIKGPGRALPRVLVAGIGAIIVILVARGAPPLPLMLPPVLIPAVIGWTFGRTLLPGRTPLVERVARGFHAPAVPSADILAYARRVTWGWSLLLGGIALINAALICCLVPGGLFALAGFAPRWPVSAGAFAWFGNTGTYLLIGCMFAVEFAVRLWRFPDYRFRNPLAFIREARTRMPNIMAALRHG